MHEMFKIEDSLTYNMQYRLNNEKTLWPETGICSVGQ